jgi:hypothetical protein
MKCPTFVRRGLLLGPHLGPGWHLLPHYYHHGPRRPGGPAARRPRALRQAPSHSPRVPRHPLALAAPRALGPGRKAPTPSRSLRVGVSESGAWGLDAATVQAGPRAPRGSGRWGCSSQPRAGHDPSPENERVGIGTPMACRGGGNSEQVRPGTTDGIRVRVGRTVTRT